MPKDKISKKNVEKKKVKLVEDKTFGLKNKSKSKKVQEYVKTIEHTVLGTSAKKELEIKQAKKQEKKKQNEEQALLGYLQKSLGAGKKKKEEKKKIEEDGGIITTDDQTEDDKTAAINIYVDPREPDPTRSNKVCDHFLEACEKNVYGWRWVCPNGGSKCTYAHFLPEGYMLKSTMDALMKMQREENVDRGHEYEIEEARAKIDPDACTPVTEETFEAWRKKRREKFLKKRKLKDKQDQQEIRGKGSGGAFLTGRALLKFDANVFKNSEDEDDDDDEEEKYERKKDDDDDKDVMELRFGLDEEEEELNREIENAKNKGKKKKDTKDTKDMKIDEELFEDDDDVDLDDLEDLE